MGSWRTLGARLASALKSRSTRRSYWQRGKLERLVAIQMKLEVRLAKQRIGAHVFTLGHCKELLGVETRRSTARLLARVKGAHQQSARLR